MLTLVMTSTHCSSCNTTATADMLLWTKRFPPIVQLLVASCLDAFEAQEPLSSSLQWTCVQDLAPFTLAWLYCQDCMQNGWHTMAIAVWCWWLVCWGHATCALVVLSALLTHLAPMWPCVYASWSLPIRGWHMHMHMHSKPKQSSSIEMHLPQNSWIHGKCAFPSSLIQAFPW